MIEKKNNVKANIRLKILSGKANPTPPIGPALGQYGVNISAFCKEYNFKTKDSLNLLIPVKIKIYEDKSYSFVLKTPPVSYLLKKIINIEKGSSQPNKNIIGNISLEDIKNIIDIKKNDLNTKNIEKAISIIKGTAKNMGIEFN